MAKEIERKFLVKDDSYKKLAIECRHIVQGYLSSSADSVIRVRIADNDAFLTVKSKTVGFQRDEFEYSIPLEDAEAMLKLCGGRVLEKYRYIVPYRNHIWEIDDFQGKCAPLVVAEIELQSPDESFDIPEFMDVEVTGNPMFYNSRLASM